MIEVENLTKYYGGKRAISDLTFQIEKGEIVGFLGLNGAGKSTTLRILACLILPSSGRENSPCQSRPQEEQEY